MLFVLFGATTEMGYVSRQHLQKKGFNIIKKKNFVPEDNVTVTRFGTRNHCPREEVLACDFVYEANGFLVGFNKNQIIDAVRGRTNSLLTFSMENLDFLRDIKATYGEYVHVVYTYINDELLSETTRNMEGMTEEEYNIRMDMARKVKTAYVQNTNLFDDVVIYGGKDSVFDLDFLCKQYDLIIDRLEKKEKMLNSRLYVELPYSGNKPFLFVSYSHKDTQKVLPILSELQRRSYRIWYDEGINGGENWSKLIGEKIKECDAFMCFITENSVGSTEVRAELYGARATKTDIIPIREGNAEFPFEVEMYLNGNYQVLDYNDKNLIDKLESAIDSEMKEI